MTEPDGKTLRKTLAGLQLLVVEDEAMVALLIEEMLVELGARQVDVAGSVAQGLLLLGDDREAPNGAVLDVNIGGEKVFPVAERLRLRGVPFIFATGYGAAGVAPAFASAPILAKPFRLRALRQALSTVLTPLATR